MRFKGITEKVIQLISNRYIVEDNNSFISEMKDYIKKEEIVYKDILRIKRINKDINTYKTLVFVEIKTLDMSKYKDVLREVVSWIALVRDRLYDTEIIDLYLFLALPTNISYEECTRIEASDKLCRKYVMLPLENIDTFLSRTFLQNMSLHTDKAENDPIVNSFTTTREYYRWLNEDMEKEWRDYLLSYSSRELAEKLMNEDENDVSK